MVSKGEVSGSQSFILDTESTYILDDVCDGIIFYFD